MEVLLFILGVVVVAEALNKLERTRPCMQGLSYQQRRLQWLKALAWGLLAIGGADAMSGPFLGHPPPTFREACMFAGFVVLIIRTRFKEG